VAFSDILGLGLGFEGCGYGLGLGFSLEVALTSLPYSSWIVGGLLISLSEAVSP